MFRSRRAELDCDVGRHALPGADGARDRGQGRRRAATQHENGLGQATRPALSAGPRDGRQDSRQVSSRLQVSVLGRPVTGVLK